VEIQPLLQDVAEQLINKNITIATAESCTGGLLAHYLTSISGSSNYFIQGIVSYSNKAKEDLLNVKHSTLETYGAVSEQTSHEMAVGIRSNASVDIGVSTTGIAGPSGGTGEKPIGLVYIGIASKYNIQVKKYNLTGNRLENKETTCYEALKLIKHLLDKK
jgi:nicotinamide-nucleotide amidase